MYLLFVIFIYYFLNFTVKFPQVQHTHRKVYISHMYSSINFLKETYQFNLYPDQDIKHSSEPPKLLLPLLITTPYKDNHTWLLNQNMLVSEFYKWILTICIILCLASFMQYCFPISHSMKYHWQCNFPSHCFPHILKYFFSRNSII